MSDESRKKTGGRGSDKPPIGNTFINDGSFLEMFKKRMEEEKKREENQNGSPVTAPTKKLKTEPKKEQTEDPDKQAESDNSISSGSKPIIQVVAVNMPFG